MATEETRKRLTIETTQSGVEKVASDINKVADAEARLTVESQKSERAQLSLDNAFAKLERRYVEGVRKQQELEKVQRQVNAAVAQNPALTERASAVLAGAASRLGAVGQQAGLARHELINLSRQAQDVAVSLGSGQGFGTVLIQQGSQILDVLGTSQGGIRGALSGLATSLRNVVTVGRVAFAGIAAGAAGAAFATADYLSQQKNVERSLIGAGRRSAMPSDINRIANDNSSLTGLSVSETREAAVEFAKTGQIHNRVIGEMIATTKNFALVTGQSSKEAAAALSGAFTNMSGIDQLNKQFNFLDAGTREYIERLLLAGKTTDAAAVANRSLSVVLKEVEATQGGLEKGWTAIGNAISNATSKVGEYIARSAGLERKSKLDSAVGIANEIEGLQSRVDRGDFNNGIGDTTQFERATARIEELRGKLRELNKELGSVDGSNFNALSIGAQQAVNALNPFKAKIMEVEASLQKIKALQAEGVLNPELGQAVTQYDLILQNLRNQETALENLRAKHAGMTDVFAKQVESLEQQNRLLRARQNGTEASVSAAIAYENAISAGANATEAAAIKSLTLKNNLMQAADAATQLGQVTLDWSEADAYIAAGGHSPGSGGFLGDAPLEMNQSGVFPTDLPLMLSPDRWSPFLAAKMQKQNYSDPAWWMQQSDALASSRDAEAQFLSGGSKADKIAGLQLQIENLQMGLAQNPQNIWQIKSLERSMQELINSVDENTAALDKVTLNPLYTQGKSALKLGYMGAASGLDFTVRGGVPGVDSVPVHILAQQGERVQVTPAAQASNDNSRTTTVNVNVIGNSQSTNRRSARQLAQRYGQIMASLS